MYRKIFKDITSLASLLSSIATVGALGFAIWAYNFSSIPDQLVQKFNSDIASLNEELIDMRREKRLLSVEKEELQSAAENNEQAIESLYVVKSQLQNQIDAYNKEKLQLELKLNQIKTESQKNEKYRREYLGENAATIIELAYHFPILMTLEDLRSKAEMARDYQKWLPVEKRIEVIEAKYSSDDESSKLNKRRASINERWRSETPKSWIYGRTLDENGKKDKEYTVAVLRKEIAEPPQFRTGLEMVEHYKNNERKEVKAMPAEDRKKFQAAVQSYIDKNIAALNQPIAVHLPLTASDEEVVQKGQEICSNIEQFKKIISDMAEAVSFSIRKAN